MNAIQKYNNLVIHTNLNMFLNTKLNFVMIFVQKMCQDDATVLRSQWEIVHHSYHFLEFVI